VESYHSLEDRLVKQAFAQVTRSHVPEDLPFVPEGQEPPFRQATRGAEKAPAAEVGANPRAASVRLRAVERTRRSGGTSDRKHRESQYRTRRGAGS
jgi:16S rRNA (cytosine1402-N4)-methyltransferase